MTATLCLKCYSNPCICGEDYKNLNTRQTLTLISVLLRKVEPEVGTIDCKVDGKDIGTYLSNLGDAPLLTKAEQLPREWVQYTKEHNKASECIEALKDEDCDTLPHPAALSTTLFFLLHGDKPFAELMDKYLKGHDQSSKAELISVVRKLLRGSNYEQEIEKLVMQYSQMLYKGKSLRDKYIEDGFDWVTVSHDKTILEYFLRLIRGVKEGDAETISKNIVLLELALSDMQLFNEVSQFDTWRWIPDNPNTDLAVYQEDRKLTELFAEEETTYPRVELPVL